MPEFQKDLSMDLDTHTVICGAIQAFQGYTSAEKPLGNREIRRVDAWSVGLDTNRGLWVLANCSKCNIIGSIMSIGNIMILKSFVSR